MENKKKKILIFSTAYFPFVGGAEVAIKEITDRLGSDFEFDMITLRFDNRLPRVEKIGNVNVYRIGFTSNSPAMSDLVKFPLKINKLLFPFLAWGKASSLHRENKYDGIWAMMAAFAGFAASFFKLNHPKVPYLLTLQEGDPIPVIKKKVRFVYPLFKNIFTKADKIQVISNYLADWAKDMKGKNIEVIPNGVNIKKFSLEIDKEIKDNLRRELGIKEGEKVLITASRLVKKNGINDILESLTYLKSNNFKAIILGDGPDRKKLEDLTAKLKLAEQIIFLGRYNNDDLPKYLAISDIFSRPSLSEGQGISFLEAMAASVPVIATQAGGIADFLFDEKRNKDKETTGWAVDIKNPKQIAEAIENILSDSNKTVKVIANAKKLVEEKYNWDNISLAMKEIFINL